MPPSTPPARPPDALGVFAKTPFAQLLAYGVDKRLTGSFVFSNAAGDAATMVVRDGAILKLKTTGPAVYLGQILFELGHLDAEALNGSLMELAKRTSFHGEILVRTRKITGGQLREGLETQAARKVHHIFSFAQDTSFSFYRGEDLLPGYGAADYPSVDPYPLLWRGVREHAVWEHVQATLARVGDGFCGIIPGATLERFAFQDEARAAIDCIRARPMGISELSNLGIVTPNTAKLIVYCLLLTRQVAFAESRRMSDPNMPLGLRSVAGMPAVAGSSRDGPDSLPATLRAHSSAGMRVAPRVISSPDMPRATTSSASSPASIRNPSSDTQPTARPASASVPTPSRTTAPGTSTVSRASLEGSHPAFAARPSAVKEELEGAPPKTLFQEAEISLARKDFERAERLCRRAHGLETENADYLALLAWIEAQRPENLTTGATQQRIAMLDRATKLDRECERSYFYRAQLYKRIDNIPGALRDFRIVTKLNPQNIEAAREVRLYEMRAKNSSGEFDFGRRTSSTSSSPPAGTKKPEKTQSGGFFEKLLKK